MSMDQRVFPVGVLDGGVCVLRAVIGKLTRAEAITLAADLIVMSDCCPLSPGEPKTTALQDVLRLVAGKIGEG